MKQLTNKIFKDTFIVMISNIINYAGMFILAVMITRFMGVDALGEFTYIFAVSTILGVISELGLSQLLVRKINAERALIFSLVRNVNIFKMFVSVLCVLLTTIVFYLFPGLNFNLTLLIGITVIIPKTIQATYDSSIRALQKQAIPSVIKSINTLMQIIFAYFILVNTGRLLNIFIMILIMETLSMFSFYFMNKILWNRPGNIFSALIPYSFSYIKPVITESLPFFGSNFLALSIPRIIVIILGYLTNAASLGIFSASSRFANGVGLFSGALYNTFYPAMTNPENSDETRYALARKFTLYAFIAGLVISLAIYFLAEILIDLTFRIPEAVPVLKLLGFVVIPVLTHTILQSFLFSQKYERFISYFYILLWIFNLITCLILVNLYGYWGAAISAFTFEYIVMIALIILFIRNKKLWILKYLKHLAKRGSTFIHPKGFEATDLLISKLNIKPSDEILEIGCGTGGTLIEIIIRYGIKVTAVEILDEMLTAAEENLKSLNLTDKAEISNIKPGEKYPFENNSFDKIYAESVIGFQDKPGMEFIFSEIRRVLKPDGIFILNDALWKKGVPDSIVNSISRQAYKDFGLAHASPSNIDIDGLIKIAAGCGLIVKEIIDLDKTIKASNASLNENNVKFNKPKNKFSLVYFTDNLRYRLKLKKHSNSGNYITSYLISFNAI